MPHDYEDLYDLGDMDDEEIADLIVQELDDFSDLDVVGLEIEVEDGRVRISGRVGTERELQQIEQLVEDLLGITDFESAVVVDELTRAEEAEAGEGEGDSSADEDEDALAGLAALGGIEADDYAVPDGHPDPIAAELVADAYGTEDLHDAIAEGRSYHPPDRPIQMGSRSRESH